MNKKKDDNQAICMNLYQFIVPPVKISVILGVLEFLLL